jgi:predicted DNA-binding protein (MmcQ/YjbR family)
MARLSFDALRRVCAGLPGATRDIKWGADEVYSVGAKMFAVFGVDAGRTTGMSFKVDEARFLELTDRDGITPAPYLARAHWVALAPMAAITSAEARELVVRSHALVLAKLPRKLRDALVPPASDPAAATARATVRGHSTSRAASAARSARRGSAR